jgi:alpha-aminoadipate/glutamate carrier protein LysW
VELAAKGFILPSKGFTVSDIRQCIECGGAITLPPNSAIGEIFSCPDCGEEFELDLHLRLKPVESVAEDWGQ